MLTRYLLFIIILVTGLYSQTNKTVINFADLQEMLDQSSPAMEILKSQNDLISAQRRADLQWSNPTLSYATERVENDLQDEQESIFTLSKEVQLPWVYWQKREFWSTQLESAASLEKLRKAELLANVKSEYVHLQLLTELVQYQNSQIETLKNLKSTLDARLDEGMVSTAEHALLSMNLFTLEMDQHTTELEVDKSESNLKMVLGIPANQVLQLNSPVQFQDIITQSGNDDLDRHPGILARQHKVTAQERMISIEKQSVIQSISLDAGYKKVDPDLSGYAVGISIPLPMLNLNRGAVAEEQVKHRLMKSELSLYETELHNRLKILERQIQRSGSALKSNWSEMGIGRLQEDLFSAYQEGYISLAEFLAAIQQHSEARRSYQEQLTNYYAALFEYETLTSQQLVTFE